MRRHLFTIVALGLLLIALLFVFGAFRGYQDGKQREHSDYCAILARNSVYSDNCP